MAVLTTGTKEITELYVAYFSRPPDPGGLGFWTDAISSGGASVGTISETFAAAPEYQVSYAGKSNSEIVDQIYTSLFGRPAEAGGREYWVGLVTSGALKVAELAAAIKAGSLGTDTEVVENKVLASIAFTAAMSDAGIATYGGGSAVDLARSFVAGVTTDGSLAAAIAPASLGKTVALVGSASSAADGMAFTLTTGVDQIVGTDGNDTLNGVIDERSLPSTTTLSAGDRLDGGAGFDTLNIRVLSNLSSSPALTVNNIERVTVQASGMLSLDTTSWRDLARLEVSEASQAVRLVAAATTDLTLALKASAVMHIDGGQNVKVGLQLVDPQASGINIAHASGAVVVDVAASASQPRVVAMGDITVEGGASIDIRQSASADLGGATLQQGAVKVIADAKTKSVVVQQTASRPMGASAAEVQVGQVQIVADGSPLAQVKVDAYGAGSGISGDARQLSALTLANSSADFSVAASAASLKLTLDQVGRSSGSANLNLRGSSDLRIDNVGNNFVALDALNTNALTLAGSGQLHLTETAMGNLLAITVQEMAGLELAADKLANLRSIDASATGGTMQVTVDGANLRYLGSAASDTVTVSGATAGLGQSILLRDGDDRLDLRALKGEALVRSGAAVEIDGGAGVDTLQLDGVAAGLFSARGAGGMHITGFERLQLALWQGDTSINLARFGNIDHVTLGGAVGAAPALSLTKSDGVLGVTEVATLRFGDLGSGAYVTVGGRSVGAASSQDPTFRVSAAEVAAAFMSGIGGDNLTVWGSLSGWTVAAGGAGTLVLTSTERDSAVADIVVAGTTELAGLDIRQGVSGQLESNIVQFHDLGEAQQYSLAGRTVTALANASQAEVASAFVSGLSTSKLGVTGSVSGWSVTAAGTAGAVKLTSTAPGNVTDLTLPASGAGSATLTLSALNSGATIRLDAASDVQVQLRDASGSADLLHLIANGGGKLASSGIETINVTSTSANTLQLDAAGAHTIRVQASQAQTLKLGASSDGVTLIDASASSGGLTFGGWASAASASRSVIGGSGADWLSSGVGAGSLSGGAGSDVFEISVPSELAQHATILDFAAGDQIRFGGIASTGFASTKLVLGADASLRNYADAAIVQLGQGQIGWFVYGDDSYLVVDAGLDGGAGFVEGEDVIVKLVGTLDLGAATYDAATGALGLGGA